MINGALPITDYDPCRTKFEVVAGEWVLFSEPAFKGCTITINPHSRPMILFIVKSIKPNPVSNHIDTKRILSSMYNQLGQRHKAVPWRIFCQPNGL